MESTAISESPINAYSCFGCRTLFSQESFGHSEMTGHSQGKKMEDLFIYWSECSRSLQHTLTLTRTHTFYFGQKGPACFALSRSHSFFSCICRRLKKYDVMAISLERGDETEMRCKLFTSLHPAVLQGSAALLLLVRQNLPNYTELNSCCPLKTGNQLISRTGPLVSWLLY